MSFARFALLISFVTCAFSWSSDARQSRDKKWDVSADFGPVSKLTIDTSEGIWVNVDVSPDGRYLYYSKDVTPGLTLEYNKDRYLGRRQDLERRRRDRQGTTHSIHRCDRTDRQRSAAVSPEVHPDQMPSGCCEMCECPRRPLPGGSRSG